LARRPGEVLGLARAGRGRRAGVVLGRWGVGGNNGAVSLRWVWPGVFRRGAGPTHSCRS